MTLTLSVEEAARLLGISRGLAYQMAARGELPILRAGRRMLVSRAGLERMADREPQAARVPGPRQPRAVRRRTAVVGGEA
jgi:excisionase family DNA binding protein